MQKIRLPMLVTIIFCNANQAVAEEDSFTALTQPITHHLNEESKLEIAHPIKLRSEEYLRAKELMSGLRGMQSPGLDSISVLGIEARNDAERRHCAELWVKQEYERTEKELKFQREVDAAWKRLMPNMLPVNMGNAAGIAHDSGGRLALFVREADSSVRKRCSRRNH